MKFFKVHIFALLTVGFFIPAFAGAISFADLNTQIAELLAQVFTLKAQVARLPEKEPEPMEPRSPSDLSCIRLERNIAYGDRGGDVTELQLFLARDSYIYPEAIISGFYGAATERAVQRYQVMNGIISYGRGYGVVGPRTRKSMRDKCPVDKKDDGGNNNNDNYEVLKKALQAEQVVGNSPFDVKFDFTLADKCISYVVDWGDGSAPLQKDMSDELCDGKAKQILVNHVYPRNGIYTAILRAGTNAPAAQLKLVLPIVSYKAVVVGGNIKPFSVSPLEGTSPLTVTAEFTLEHPACTSYMIDWGDGKQDSYEVSVFACSRNIQHRKFRHTYSTPGQYEVKFKKGGDLLSNLPVTEKWLVNASELQPGKVVIELTDTSGHAPLTIRAKLVTNDGICTSYSVDWGDGGMIQSHEWLPPIAESGSTDTSIADGDFVSVNDSSFVSENDQGYMGEDPACIEPFTQEFSHTYVSPGMYPLRIRLGKGALKDIEPAQHWVSVFER